MTNISPMKLGIVGQPSSGKDTVAAYLVNRYGFSHFSSGDFIRKYVEENNLGEPTRPLLQQVGNSLREKHGSDFLVRTAFNTKADHLVISGIRNAGDVNTLKKQGGKLIAVDVPLEKRYERVRARNRTGDNLTFEEFKKQQAAEESNPNPSAQNVSTVIKMADYVIPNDGSLEDLYQKIDSLLEKMSERK